MKSPLTKYHPLSTVPGANLINAYYSMSQKEKPIMRSLEISDDLKTRYTGGYWLAGCSRGC